MWRGRDRERMVGRFFLENVWSKAHSWDDGNLFFQATYAESKLFGQIDGQPRYSAGGFARGGRDSAMSIWARFLCWLRAWNIMEWAYPTSHQRPIHITRWKVESMPPCWVRLLPGPTIPTIASQMCYGCSIASCGVAGGPAIKTTVYPFIIRGAMFCSSNERDGEREREILDDLGWTAGWVLKSTDGLKWLFREVKNPDPKSHW